MFRQKKKVEAQQSGKGESKLTREQSLSAKPVASKVISSESLPGGGVRVSVPYQPSKMQRLILRVPDTLTRQFELDVIGAEVLAHCDGQKTVRYIIEAFTKKHRVHPHEAERAVVAFLEMMLTKGLIVMVVEK